MEKNLKISLIVFTNGVYVINNIYQKKLETHFLESQAFFVFSRYILVDELYAISRRFRSSCEYHRILVSILELCVLFLKQQSMYLDLHHDELRFQLEYL